LHTNFPVVYHDPHNEYFVEWLSFGILGIALLVAILAVQFIKAVRTKNYLYLYLLIVLSTTFFTETVLSLQRGVMLYAVFTSLMFYSPLTPKGEPENLTISK
jgi:O-antigen ligase